MKRQDTGRPRSRIDHFAPGGDTVAWQYDIDVFDPSDSIVFYLKIKITVSNALGVAGNIADLEKALSVLDHAKDAIGPLVRQGGTEIPARDIQIPGIDARRIEIRGPIENREYTLAVLENAKEALRNMHAAKAVISTSPVITSVKL